MFCPASGACLDLSTDPHHCGECNRDCFGAACVAGSCQPVVVATGQTSPYGIVVDSSFVYWTNIGDGGTGQVLKVALDGGMPVILAAGQAAPMGIGVDSTAVYWVTTGGSGRVLKRFLDGGTPITLAVSSPGTAAGDLALNSRVLAWLVSAYGVVTVPLGGGAPLLIADSRFSASLAISETEVVWADDDPYLGGIWRASLDGGGAPFHVAQPSGLHGAIAFDGTDVFFDESPWNAHFLRTIPKGGWPAATLYSDPSWTGRVGGTGIAVDSSSVYFIVRGTTGRIMKVPRDGGVATTLATNQANPSQLALDGTHLYWTNCVSLAAGGGQVMKVAK